MRTYLIVMRGIAPFTVNADNRSAARTYALELHGYTPTGPAPRAITIVTV